VVQIDWLHQLQSHDRAQVGDRAWFLSQVLQRGYPVAPGAVIPAEAFQACLEQIEKRSFSGAYPEISIRESLNVKIADPWQLQGIAQQLRQAIATTKLLGELSDAIHQASTELSTPTLILRPSLSLPGLSSVETASIQALWDEQICAADPDAMTQALLHLWADVFSAKSLLYWQHRQIALEQIDLAVLVQPLQASICAGFLEGDVTGIHIQAAWGHPWAIARGEVIPDLYDLNPDGTLTLQQLGHQTLAYGTNHIPLIFDPQARLATESPSYLPEASPSSSPGLQAYWLSEALQQQESLSADQSVSLANLAQALWSDFDHPFTLEWSFNQIHGETSPQLSITSLYLDLPNQPDSRELESTKPMQWIAPAAETAADHRLFKGQAASSGRAIARALVLDQGQALPQQIPSKTILIAPTLSPDSLPLLRQAVGIVTEGGGLTSHSAILARELGIPAVVGVADITQQVRSGDSLLIDGNRGEVHRVLASVQQAWQSSVQLPENPSNSLENLPITFPHCNLNPGITAAMMPSSTIATQLMVNLSQVKSIEQVKALPIDGVGLLRSELMILEFLEQQHPQKWLEKGRQAELTDQLANAVMQFTSAFYPRPVFYRCLDLRSHEFQALKGTPSVLSQHPMLGVRGTLSYQLDSTLFDLELAALRKVQQAGYSNLHVLLPFVRTVEEFIFCRTRIEQAGLRNQTSTQLWIMAEVPSVLFLLPDYVAAGVEGISIGTNDLTQLLLGVDRDDPQLTALNERHPAVQRAIAQLISQATEQGIPCSICGDAPTLYPELIDALIEWGISSISVNAQAFEDTHRAIARAEQRLILQASRQIKH
jgi:pyruvate,water dikinase